ncbi:copia protein [Tanacetum coccineum]
MHEDGSIASNHSVQPSTPPHISDKAHLLDQVIGEPSRLVMTRSRLSIDSEVCMYVLTVSTIEPKNIKEAMSDHNWIESMQDELHQFQWLDIWELVPWPTDRNVIAVKWLWKNKSNAKYIVILKQYVFVDKGLQQEREHQFEDSLAPVARLEAVRMFVAYAAYKNFTIFQMVVKTAFLNGSLKEEISIAASLITSRPDIAFATFVCVPYQARPTVKHLKEVKRVFRYLRQSYNMGLWYSKDSGFELIAYSDANHTGCHDDCKSTSGGLQFLGEQLVRWSSKKQDCTALCTTEAEYVSLSACYAQVIWMRTQLFDYGYKFNKIPMYRIHERDIDFSCNLVITRALSTLKSGSIVLRNMLRELSIPEQTATGKGIPNPLMAGSLPKTIKSTELDVVVLLKRQVADEDG